MTESVVVPDSRHRSRITLILWVIAAAVSIVVLVVAVVGRDRGDRPTLRAMAVRDSMSEEQAHAVADNTVRVWIRERNAGHVANLEALSCPSGMRRGTLAAEIDGLHAGQRDVPVEINTTGAFGRFGPVWTLSTHFRDAAAVFSFRVLGDELRVCDINAAPIP